MLLLICHELFYIVSRQVKASLSKKKNVLVNTSSCRGRTERKREREREWERICREEENFVFWFGAQFNLTVGHLHWSAFSSQRGCVWQLTRFGGRK